MASPTERLLLIDGYGQIYRAFYSVQGLTNARGEPTNALFGLARFILKLDQDVPHGYGAVCLDKGRPPRRMELLPEYKQTRPPMPDALRAQLDPIRAWITACGWPVIQEEGHEADDFIAAIVNAREGRETAIISHDKDLAQLVSGDDVYILVPGPKGAMERLGPAEVTAKFDVPPEGIRDYLALVGDTADNIPGVNGIGPKTAAALLQEFGSIQAILEGVDRIKKTAVREKIRASVELIRRNIEIVGLDATLPIGWQGVCGLRKRPVQWATLMDIARDNQFTSLLGTIEKARQAYENPALF